jgi:hypothetical protein
LYDGSKLILPSLYWCNCYHKLPRGMIEDIVTDINKKR